MRSLWCLTNGRCTDSLCGIIIDSHKHKVKANRSSSQTPDWHNVVLMLVQRRRRCANIKTALNEGCIGSWPADSVRKETGWREVHKANTINEIPPPPWSVPPLYTVLVSCSIVSHVIIFLRINNSKWNIHLHQVRLAKLIHSWWKLISKLFESEC